jgi:hypothetical protein
MSNVAHIADLYDAFDLLVSAARTTVATEGRVCEMYEICEHAACAASYGAWALADSVLKEKPVRRVLRRERLALDLDRLWRVIDQATGETQSWGYSISDFRTLDRVKDLLAEASLILENAGLGFERWESDPLTDSVTP